MIFLFFFIPNEIIFFPTHRPICYMLKVVTNDLVFAFNTYSYNIPEINSES